MADTNATRSADGATVDQRLADHLLTGRRWNLEDDERFARRCATAASMRAQLEDAA